MADTAPRAAVGENRRRHWTARFGRPPAHGDTAYPGRDVRQPIRTVGLAPVVRGTLLVATVPDRSLVPR